MASSCRRVREGKPAGSRGSVKRAVNAGRAKRAGRASQADEPAAPAKQSQPAAPPPRREAAQILISLGNLVSPPEDKPDEKVNLIDRRRVLPHAVAWPNG